MTNYSMTDNQKSQRKQRKEMQPTCRKMIASLLQLTNFKPFGGTWYVRNKGVMTEYLRNLKNSSNILLPQYSSIHPCCMVCLSFQYYSLFLHHQLKFSLKHFYPLIFVLQLAMLLGFQVQLILLDEIIVECFSLRKISCKIRWWFDSSEQGKSEIMKIHTLPDQIITQ